MKKVKNNKLGNVCRENVRQGIVFVEIFEYHTK